MLPPLTPDGLLPPGVHEGSLGEVIARFGGSSAKRAEVTQQLRRIVETAQRTGRLRRLFIWGSYVTRKAEPNDIDLMLSRWSIVSAYQATEVTATESTKSASADCPAPASGCKDF